MEYKSKVGLTPLMLCYLIQDWQIFHKDLSLEQYFDKYFKEYSDAESRNNDVRTV